MSRPGAALAAAYLLSALLPGTSCQPGTAGELMLVIDTDLSVPKDLDQISVQVNGDTLDPWSYTLRDAALPTTLAIVAGDDPSVTAQDGHRARAAGSHRHAARTAPVPVHRRGPGALRPGRVLGGRPEHAAHL